MTVRLERDELGPKAVVFDRWTPDDAKTVRHRGIRRLQIAAVRHDLSFLADLDGIDEVRVIDHMAGASDAGVIRLPGLRVLGLETYSTERIDFGVFHELERLHLNWRPGAESAFECTTLKSLSMARYPYEDLAPLSRLAALEGLRIASASRLTTVAGVEQLARLVNLRLLGDRKLGDLAPLGGGELSLTGLYLDGCRKVRDVGALSQQVGLRSLALLDGGRIASIAPLADLAVLEEFWFYGTTVIEDGDLFPLLRMPALRRIAFARRRHYSHTPEDITRLRGLKETDPLPHWRW